MLGLTVADQRDTLWGLNSFEGFFSFVPLALSPVF
jgi:hypothetical protein